MRLSNQQKFIATISFAMCLRVLSLPHFLHIINPDWVLLVLIYWTLIMPYRRGVFTAWAVGLLTDVLIGRALGEYALIYTLVSYLCIKLKRLRFVPLMQQSVFVFICLLLAQLLLFVIENIQSPTVFSATFWLPVFVGTALWPFVHPALHFICHLGRKQPINDA